MMLVSKRIDHFFTIALDMNNRLFHSNTYTIFALWLIQLRKAIWKDKGTLTDSEVCPCSLKAWCNSVNAFSFFHNIQPYSISFTCSYLLDSAQLINLTNSSDKEYNRTRLATSWEPTTSFVDNMHDPNVHKKSLIIHNFLIQSYSIWLASWSKGFLYKTSHFHHFHSSTQSESFFFITNFKTCGA